MKDYQFNLFTVAQAKPVGKVPISKADIEKAKALFEKGDHKSMNEVLREVRYKLEAFERSITTQKPKK